VRAVSASRGGTFSSLHNRNYRHYFLGQVVSLIGTWMQQIALPWLVYERTHSGTDLGLIVAVQSLPILFLSPYGGVVVDRMDKRRLLIMTQSTQGLLALVLGVLTLTHTVEIWMIVLIALGAGLAGAFDNPARQSIVLELVGKSELRNAVSLNSVTINIARAVGPAIAAGVIAGALERIDARSRVLLVGTGLTMVDVALSLGRAEHGRMLHARSRHGLVPERHCGSTTTGWEGKVEPATTARELMRSIRVAVNKAEFAGDDWRAVVAGVRRQVPELWSALAVEERRRLCRHALRYWEIHRHRMAPAVVAELDRVRSAGRLDVGRGRLGAIDVSGDKLRAHLTGGEQGDELLEVEAVVNCTGPSGERTGGSRLLTSLIDSGLARADAIGMGVDTDIDGHLVGGDGTVTGHFHVVGSGRRGGLLETTAVPEIRCQAERLAKRLTAQPGHAAR